MGFQLVFYLFQWFQYAVDITLHPLSFTENPNPQKVRSGENGGKITSNKLVIESLEWKNNGGVYLCRATNGLSEESVNDGLTLDVRCKISSSLYPLSKVSFSRCAIRWCHFDQVPTMHWCFLVKLIVGPCRLVAISFNVPDSQIYLQLQVKL